MEATVSSPLPDRITNENVKRFVFKASGKTATPNAVGPVTLSQDTTCDTKEGAYDLPSGWSGYFALDGDGDVYPVEKSVFESSYEEIDG